MKIVIDKKSSNNSVIFLYCMMLLFKAACDVGYSNILIRDTVSYRNDFNVWKFVVGFICVSVIFFSINHRKKKASSFFLMLLFIMQIIPITTVYSFGNESSHYYLPLCVCFFCCSCLMRVKGQSIHVGRNSTLSNILMFLFVCLTCIVMLIIIMQKGLPTFTALNIYRVYEIRSRGGLVSNRYINYMVSWVMSVFFPFFILLSFRRKKYSLTVILLLFVLLIFLYSGNKVYLFGAPLVMLCVLWTKRENCYQELFCIGCFGFAILVGAAFFESDYDVGLFNKLFSLFGRRLMFVPANNKFKYFDFFSTHQKLGLYGIFPRWLINTQSVYSEIPYSFQISKIYYGKPEMNSNTGFLVEGFSRWGYMGFLYTFATFFVLLKSIDSFQKRTTYQIAVCLFVYPVLCLNDLFLIDSLAFGPWMILIIILLFYRDIKSSERNQANLIEVIRNKQRHMTSIGEAKKYDKKTYVECR